MGVEKSHEKTKTKKTNFKRKEKEGCQIFEVGEAKKTDDKNV